MSDDKSSSAPTAGGSQETADVSGGAPAGVTVVNKHNEVYQIPAATAAETLKNDTDGFHVATPQDLKRIEDAKKYGGISGAAGAAGLGVARGLTFGLSDPAARAIGGDSYTDYANSVREANPNISAAAEGAGMLAGALATDGAGLAARTGRGLTLIPRVVSGAGHLAGELAERAVGRSAEGYLARGLQGAARSAAQAGTEGALMSIGNQISEDTLNGDDQLHAENLLAATGHGLMTGAAFGAPLGFAGGLVGRTMDGWLSKVPSVESLESSAQENAARGLGLKMHAYKKLGLRDVYDESGELIANANTPEARIAEAKQMGKVALDNDIIDHRVSDHLEAGERATRLQERTADELAQQRAKINQLGKFDVNDLRDKIRSEIYDPLMANSNPEFHAIAEDIQDRFNGAFSYKSQVSFDEAYKFRRELDQILNARGSFDREAGLRDQYLQQVRGALETEYESQAEKLAGINNPQLLNDYKSTKWLYGKLADINDVLKDEAARDWSNQRRGIKDWITGGTIASIGTNIGGMIGGPVGAAVGGTAGGFLGSEANAFVRNRGSNIAASLYRGAATYAAMNDLQSQISNAMERGVNSFVNGSSRVANTVTNISGRPKPLTAKSYMDKADQIRQLAANPDEIRKRVANLVPPEVAQHAPNVTVAMGDAAVRKYQFLASKLPPNPTAMNMMQPFLSARAPSGEHIAKFSRYLIGADHPFQVLDMAAKGTLNRDVLESFSAIYPSLYSNLLQQVARAVGRKRKGMTISQMNALGIMFKSQMTPMQSPQWIAMAQASFDPKFSQNGDGGIVANGNSDGGQPDAAQSGQPPTGPVASNTGSESLGDKPARPIDIGDAFKTTSQGWRSDISDQLV
jgi:hypothetical protein